MAYLDDLRRLRTEATLEACSSGGLFDAPKVADVRLELKQQRATMPQFVVVNLPELNPSIGALAMKVRPSLEVQALLSVELRPENLAYLREALQRFAEDKKPEHRQPKGKGGVSWLPSRKAFVAKRRHADGSKMQYKTFKPDLAADEASKADALAKARAWTSGCSLEDIQSGGSSELFD